MDNKKGLFSGLWTSHLFRGWNMLFHQEQEQQHLYLFLSIGT